MRIEDFHQQYEMVPFKPVSLLAKNWMDNRSAAAALRANVDQKGRKAVLWSAAPMRQTESMEGFSLSQGVADLVLGVTERGVAVRYCGWTTHNPAWKPNRFYKWETVPKRFGIQYEEFFEVLTNPVVIARLKLLIDAKDLGK